MTQRPFIASPTHHWTALAADGVHVHSLCWKGREKSTPRPPLILVAGLGCSSRYWMRLGPRLADQFDVLAPDLPGFGKTPKPKSTPWPGGPGVREQADQLLAWMDARGIAKAVLCGHSVGCQTAVDVAARFPERVEKLILTAPTYERGHRTLGSHIPRLLVGALVEAPSLTPLLVGEYLRSGVVRVLQQAVRTMADPIEGTLPNVLAPTLVIRGSLDPLVRQRWTETVAKTLPRAALVVIDGVGHAVHYSSAAVMAEVVRAFISGPFDIDRPLGAGPLLGPKDDPRRDPLGPPQPISPAVHRTLDWMLAAAALAIPRLLKWDRRPRRWLTALAAGTLANSFATNSAIPWKRRGPMLTHANVDVVAGLMLIAAASKKPRRARSGHRRALLAFGLYNLIAATLTAKPTGPARRSTCTRA